MTRDEVFSEVNRDYEKQCAAIPDGSMIWWLPAIMDAWKRELMYVDRCGHRPLGVR